MEIMICIDLDFVVYNMRVKISLKYENVFISYLGVKFDFYFFFWVGYLYIL